MKAITAEEVNELRASGQFDAEWYVKEYPDVAMSGMDPAEHFLWIGTTLGRTFGISHITTFGQPLDLVQFAGPA